MQAGSSGRKGSPVAEDRDDNEKAWSRYLVLLAIFCILLACALTVYIQKLNETVEQETKTYLAECGDQAAHNVRDDFRLLLNSAAMMADFVGRSDENLFNHEFLLTLAARSRSAYFSYLGIADVKGIMHTIDGRVLYVGDRSYFREALNGRANISELLTQKTGGEKCIVFAAPVTRGGIVRGVLCAPLDPRDFVSIFRISVFNGYGHSYITDENGNIIMSQVGFEAKGNIAREINAAGDSVLNKLQAEMAAGRDGVCKFFSSGGVKYVGYTRIGYNHWYLLMTIPDNIVNKRFAGFSRVTAYCGVFLFVFFALLALLTSKIFIEKSKKLHDTMKDLQASEERYKIVTENSDEHIFEWNLSNDLVYSSPSFEKQFGAAENKDDRSIQAVLRSSKIHQDDKAKLASLCEEFQNGRVSGGVELRLRTADSSVHWCSLNAISTYAGGSRRIVGVLKDIDEEHRERERLLHQAQTDKLTGLYDKLTTQNTIEEFLSGCGRNGRHTMLVFDVDDFKALNDNYGHLFGDTVLQHIAAKMKDSFRSDDVAGRIGGDEFMALLKDASDLEFVKRKTHELAEALRHCMDDMGHKNCVSVSIGVAAYPADADNFKELYEAADAALYQAKNSGKNSFAICRKGREAQVFKCDERERGLNLLAIGGGEGELRGILETDYNVVDARNRAEATRLLREVRDVGAVVVDISGQEQKEALATLSVMKEEKSVADIPMIVLSDRDNCELRSETAEAGASEFIAKPCAPDYLRSRVRSLIALSVLSHMEKEKQLYKDLSNTNSKLQSIIDTFPCGIAMIKLSPDGVITPTFFSDAFCRLSGSTRSFIESCNLFSFIMPDDRASVLRLAGDVLERGVTRVSATFRIINQTGETRWINMTGEQFHVENGCHMFSLIFVDTTDKVFEQQEKERKAAALRYKSRHDPLTGVYNRETFFSETEKLLREKPQLRFAMVCSDVDRFNIVNDLFGNKTGDRVLSAIPGRFIPMDDPDCRYGRLGGDVFAFCLPYDRLRTEKLENTAKCHFPELGDAYELTIRFGICIIDDQGLPADVISDRAVLALRTIKGSYTRHCAFYNNALRDKLIGEQDIIGSMERAISNGEFEVWLQPIYDAKTERPVMAEALARWNRRGRNFLMPASFIPLFEQNGFITRLDAFVWDNVCRKLAELNESGIETLPISVNMSRLDFYAGSVCDDLVRLTGKYHVEPRLLRLEVTESTYADNPARIGEAVKELHRHGFTMMVDDFGSGLSTLSMIKEVPMDMLKIDKKLIDGIENSPRSRIVVESTIQMAAAIGMKAVAEGVETAGQVETLRQMGCDMVQGFYYARPMPWQEFKQLLTN